MKFTGGEPLCAILQQDMKEPGSTNVDPIFTNNKLPDGNEPGCGCGVMMHKLCSTFLAVLVAGDQVIV